MTQEEKNIKIALACGKPVCVHHPDKWERRGTDGDSELYCTECAKYLHDMRVERYFSDLNAMAEAENLLTIDQMTTMSQYLHRSFGMLWGFATAAQRAEAFGQTLGLWND